MKLIHFSLFAITCFFSSHVLSQQLPSVIEKNESLTVTPTEPALPKNVLDTTTTTTTLDKDKVPLSANLQPPETISSDDVQTPKPDVSIVTPNNETNASESTRENMMIPVFSEWTQQQIQEAEKKLVELTNLTDANKEIKNETLAKHQVVKMRQKNYASPDCGAKVLASNPEAQSTSSVLTDKDEYLLSPCTDRIWFVVELCDSIQAQRVELANFELFSSPLKSVTISVSNRFPTREWTPAGQFVAKTERGVQLLELSSTLFGKFVRVDLTYTNTEHYCPLSFFRIFGTSEMEAFEVENEPGRMMDVDDDFEHAAKSKKQEPNKDTILNRAGAAMMSIVHKAAEVLVKSNDAGLKANVSMSVMYHSNCTSFSHNIMCKDCSNVERMELDDVISCKSRPLSSLLESSDIIRTHLINSVECRDVLGFTLKSKELGTRKNFLVSILPKKYIAAMCNMVAKDQKALPPRIEIIPGINSSLISKKDEVSLKNLSKKQDPVEESHCKPDLYETTTKPTVLNNTSLEPDKVTANTVTVEKTVDTKNAVISGDELNIFNVIEQEKQQDTSSTDPKTTELNPATDKNTETRVEVKSKDENKTEEAVKANEKLETVVDPSKLTIVLTGTTKTPESNPPEDKIAPPTVKPLDLETKQEVKAGQPEVKSTQPESVEVKNNGDYRSSNPPESVFLRLSNRIKTLEKNMTLSTQYLEELSRRYKKQIEDLQQLFSKLQTSVEEQNTKKYESDKRDVDENKRVRSSVVDLNQKFENLEVILIILATFFIVQTVFVVALFKRLSIMRKAFAAHQLSQESKEMPLPSPSLSNGEKGRTGRKRSKQRFRKISAPNILTQRSPVKSEFHQTSPMLSRTVSAPNKFDAIMSLEENKENFDDIQAMLEENDDILIPGFGDLKLNDDESIRSIDADTASTASAVSSNEKPEKSSSNKSFKFKRRLSSPFQLNKSSMKKASSFDRTNNVFAKKAMSESPSRVANENSNEIQKSKSMNDEDDTNSMKFKKSNSFKKLFKKLF